MLSAELRDFDYPGRMLFSPLLLVFASPFLPQEESVRVMVDSQGSRIVRSLQDASGAVVATSQGGSVRAGGGLRWEQDDAGLNWVVKNVAAGDFGSSALAGKGLNNESVTLFAAGSENDLFDFSTLGSEYPWVAMADQAPVGAALVVTNVATTGIDFEGVLQVWDTTGNGTPDWTYTFPRTLNHFGGGVEISDDGNIIFVWKGDPNSGTCLIRVYDRVGSLLSSSSLAVAGSYYSRGTILSDDGTRAYFGMGSSAVIWDVLGGQLLHLENIGASFDSHAMSADGTRFAYGGFGWFRVYGETIPGGWTLLHTESFSGSQYASHLALDADGSTCAYQIQTYSPAYDTLRVGMLDVDAGSVLFEEVLTAPGTTSQLAGGDCAILDDGSVAAFGSWGDSLNQVPEALTRDASGNALSNLDLDGSVFDLDLAPGGDVLVGGNKSVHANTFGNGGSFWVSDPDTQDFHIEGVPQLGQLVTFTIEDGWAKVGFAAARALGSSSTPWGVSSLDLSTLLWQSRAISVPKGGLTLPITLPSLPSMAGLVVHLQSAVFSAGGSSQMTNKVSLRLLP